MWHLTFNFYLPFMLMCDSTKYNLATTMRVANNAIYGVGVRIQLDKTVFTTVQFTLKLVLSNNHRQHRQTASYYIIAKCKNKVFLSKN